LRPPAPRLSGYTWWSTCNRGNAAHFKLHLCLCLCLCLCRRICGWLRNDRCCTNNRAFNDTWLAQTLASPPRIFAFVFIYNRCQLADYVIQRDPNGVDKHVDTSQSTPPTARCACTAPQVQEPHILPPTRRVHLPLQGSPPCTMLASLPFYGACAIKRLCVRIKQQSRPR
jgi:hypothetical protein